MSRSNPRYLSLGGLREEKGGCVMDDMTKNRIRKLREENMSYSDIARLLDIKENTVKTFCRRNGLNGARALPKTDSDHICPNCGKAVMQTPGRKPRRFCSSFCRNSWWNAHLDQVNRKANYEILCPGCGKTFISYGNRNRKYCSHACYIVHRFGGKDVERTA